MKFGIFDHLDRYDVPLHVYYEDRLRLIEAYDKAGFYSYHLAEHHSTPLGMAPSPNVFLSAIAQRTRTLRFGPLVYALPLHHPLRMIEEICMLDQMSGGRLDMGFGRGSSPIEIELYGEDPARSERLYVEGLELIKSGLTRKTLNFEGETWRFKDVPMELEPFQKPYPPIWYGVHSPDSAERAARQGLNTVSLDPVPETILSADHYRAVWRQLHGDKALPLIGLGRFIVVAEDDATALAAARRAYPKWHDSFTYLFRRMNRPQQKHPRPATFDLLMEVGQGVAGSPETVTAYLKSQMTATGCNYLVGQFAFGDLSLAECLHSLDLFTRHVMPELARM